MVYRTTIPGLPGGPLETSFPVKIMLAPAWRTNVRPGIKARRPRVGVCHETGNPNTMAVSDARYLQNGSGGRQASWHITVDDTEAYIGIPVDEVTWQASDGAGPGNYNGISIEHAVARQIMASPARKQKCRSNGAEIHGKIAARFDAQTVAKAHYDFAPDKKWCPAHMLSEGYFRGNAARTYVKEFLHFYNMEKAAMAGKPYTPVELKVGAEAVTTANLNVRGTPSTTGALWATLPAGQTVTIIDGPRTDPAYQWWRVEWRKGTTAVSGWAAANWLEATKPAPDAPDPDTDGPVKGDAVKVTANLYLRQGWGTDSRATGLLMPGTTAAVIDGPQFANGYRWVDIKGEFGTGWVADAWLEVTGTAPAEPEKTYAKPLPVTELLETNLDYDEIADGLVTANETEFIYTANVIEFKRTTPALQYANDSAPEVRDPYHEGDRAVEAWRCLNHDGIWYSLLTGPDDEWVRVRSDHAVVVSGSPLLGDDLVGKNETSGK